METKQHTTFATTIVGIVVAVAFAAPAAFSMPRSDPPAFTSAVPSQPGQLTGRAADPARARERYYTSYGASQSLSRPAASADGGSVDWTPIGISVGASIVLIGAVIALSRMRRRTHRMRVVA